LVNDRKQGKSNPLTIIRKDALMDDIICLSATALAQAIRDKNVSSLDVVKAYLARIEAVNPVINAVVQLAPERALGEARVADAALARGEIKGPLHGVPMTLKDSIDTAGIITTAGTTGRRNFIPDKDATVAARLRQAGAILLGKTNTPELTLYGETVNLVYGRTSNPYNPDRIPGGSSGGAAAIVAACGSPFDLGTDTGGSIRQPAHFCGVAGLKPTSGRVPRTGHIISYEMGALDSLTQIGPLARYVEDLALIFPIISGVDWRDPAIVPMPVGEPGDVELAKLRTAYYIDNQTVSPTAEVADTVKSAISALSDTGMTLEENRPVEVETAIGMWLKLGTADGAAWTRRILEASGTTEIDPILQNRFLSHSAISTPEFTALLAELDRVRSGMLRFMERYDVIICPTNAFPAMPHGEVNARGDGYTYTRIYNLTGWPVVVVRCGTSPDGMPIGVQVVARPWREDVALAVAAHLEKVCGGWQRPPI
jgi:amidase